MSDTVLAVEQLSVGFDSDDGPIPVIEDVSFELSRGETLALVGESGCGKTLSALAILGLLPSFGRITRGAIRLEGRDLTHLDDHELAGIRGHRISMIFQEPMSALNPVFTVGQQVGEALRLHRHLNRDEVRGNVIEMLAAVGIPDPESRTRDYPHQLSGGMRQRILIAMALACNPDVLIADEPTTALDVTIQAQIMDLMLDLQDRMGTAILFISHDFAVVSHMADHVAVMYAGRVIEQGPCTRVIGHAQHPYTCALLETTPRMTTVRARLPAIPGRVPTPAERSAGCPFRPRCNFALQRCAEELPALIASDREHLAACHEIGRV